MKRFNEDIQRRIQPFSSSWCFITYFHFPWTRDFRARGEICLPFFFITLSHLKKGRSYHRRRRTQAQTTHSCAYSQLNEKRTKPLKSSPEDSNTLTLFLSITNHRLWWMEIETTFWFNRQTQEIIKSSFVYSSITFIPTVWILYGRHLADSNPMG